MSPGRTNGLIFAAASRTSTGSWLMTRAANAFVSTSPGHSTTGNSSSFTHSGPNAPAKRGEANKAPANSDHIGSTASE